MLYLLGPTVQGKKTPVPPFVILLLGPGPIGFVGATMTRGAALSTIPYGEGIKAWGPYPAIIAPFGIFCGGGVPGCQSVIALVGEETMGEISDRLGGGLTLTKLMLTRLLEEGQTTCLAMSALFPRITRSDLHQVYHVTL